MNKVLAIVITKRTEPLDDYYPDGGWASVYIAQYKGKSAIGFNECNAVSRLLKSLLFSEEITETEALDTLMLCASK
jgi:hypothetical protein